METPITINPYKSYGSSVGNNLKSIQITTKYKYHMLRQEKLRVFCKVAIEEACKRWIELIILKVLPEHHLIVDCPRTMSDAKVMQLFRGFSSYCFFTYALILGRDTLKEGYGAKDIIVKELEARSLMMSLIT